MDTWRQVQVDRGPCLKHTSIPNQYLFVRVRVTNLLSVKLHYLFNFHLSEWKSMVMCFVGGPSLARLPPSRV